MTTKGKSLPFILTKRTEKKNKKKTQPCTANSHLNHTQAAQTREYITCISNPQKPMNVLILHPHPELRVDTISINCESMSNTTATCTPHPIIYVCEPQKFFFKPTGCANWSEAMVFAHAIRIFYVPRLYSALR